MQIFDLKKLRKPKISTFTLFIFVIVSTTLRLLFSSSVNAELNHLLNLQTILVQLFIFRDVTSSSYFQYRSVIVRPFPVKQNEHCPAKGLDYALQLIYGRKAVFDPLLVSQDISFSSYFKYCSLISRSVFTESKSTLHDSGIELGPLVNLQKVDCFCSTACVTGYLVQFAAQGLIAQLLYHQIHERIYLFHSARCNEFKPKLTTDQCCFCYCCLSCFDCCWY